MQINKVVRWLKMIISEPFAFLPTRKQAIQEYLHFGKHPTWDMKEQNFSEKFRETNLPPRKMYYKMSSL